MNEQYQTRQGSCLPQTTVFIIIAIVIMGVAWPVIAREIRSSSPVESMSTPTPTQQKQQEVVAVRQQSQETQENPTPTLNYAATQTSIAVDLDQALADANREIAEQHAQRIIEKQAQLDRIELQIAALEQTLAEKQSQVDQFQEDVRATQIASNATVTAEVLHTQVSNQAMIDSQRRNAEIAVIAARRDQEIRTTEWINTGIRILLVVLFFILVGILIAIYDAWKRIERRRQANQRKLEQIKHQGDVSEAYNKADAPLMMDLYKFITTAISYYTKQGSDGTRQITIPHYLNMNGFAAGTWVKLTDTLVRHNYLIKSHGRSSILRNNLTLGDMEKIISQGLFFERDAITRIK